MNTFTNPLLDTLAAARHARVDQYPVQVLGLTVERNGNHVWAQLPDGDMWFGNYGMSLVELEQALTEYMEDVQ